MHRGNNVQCDYIYIVGTIAMNYGRENWFLVSFIVVTNSLTRVCCHFHVGMTKNKLGAKFGVNYNCSSMTMRW